MNDIEKAKSLLQSSAYSCVLCKGDTTYTSTESGILPMVGFISGGKDLKGFSAADKIVGKAAAMLFVLAGAKEVYAPVMSEAAVHTLSQYGISNYCDILAKSIINRKGTGICPMEKAVEDIQEPFAAFEAIKQTMDTLRSTSEEQMK